MSETLAGVSDRSRFLLISHFRDSRFVGSEPFRVRDLRDSKEIFEIQNFIRHFFLVNLVYW